MLTIIIITASIVLYTYLLYPVMLLTISKIWNNHHKAQADHKPFISIIIPVYNGGSLIKKKVENTRSILYPHNKLEIIFVSDGSDDETFDILKSERDIISVILKKRSGKELAIKAGLEKSKGDLICLSDIGIMINSEGLKNMASHFKNEKIGAVSSVDKTDFGSYSLETFHINFVNKVRTLESNISSVVGVSGSFFLARKNLLENLSVDCCSDLAIALECERNNCRAIVEPLAYGEYKKSSSVSVELHRKIRTSTQGMRTLLTYKDLLNPFLYGWFSVQLISHKILRWMSPISLAILLLLTSIFFIAEISTNKLILFLLFMALALLIPIIRKFICNNIALFVVYNIAPIASIFYIAKKKDFKVWRPTKRN
jgi:cellulose synthase/poly-beta-1,6-N-acetylglucosamine synthase-like glycosyltransferase